MDYETITDAFEALDHKQQLEVLVILTKTAYKGAGGKKSSSGAKRAPSEGFLKWNSLVSDTYAEMKELNPKTTRAEAMEEAARRLDEMDPEGAPKRAAERAKRAAKKTEKDGDAKSTKSSSSKSAKKSSSAFASDSEEEAPKKKASTKPAAKPSKPAPKEPELESEAEKAEDSKPDYKGVKVKGKNYILNQSTNAAYEAVEDGEGGFNPGPYAGLYKKENGKASIDADVPEPTA
jgi:hypothetical protein